MRQHISRIVLGGALLVGGLSAVYAEEPPAGGTPKDFQLPKKTTFELDNGLGVTLVPYGEVPKVDAAIVVRAGNAFEAADEIWLADLTGSFLQEGTTSRSNIEIAQEAARIGGTLNIGTNPDNTIVSGDALAEFAPDLVSLLGDMVMNSSFPESELERLRNDYARQLSVQKTQPQSLAQEQFRALMYGDHPYGRVFPTEAMIQGYGIDDVKGFYEENYGAGRAHLYVVGVFDQKAVEKVIRDELSSWKTGGPASVPEPNPTSGRTVHLIDRPGAPQSTILMGCPTIDPSHEDYVALQLMNTLLGGSFMSRMVANIREDKGYSYSPSAQISIRQGDAYWAEQADVTTQHTGATLKEVYYEIDRLQSEPPSEEELEAFKNLRAGIYVLQNSTRNGIINQLSFLELHGLPDTYLSEYVQNVMAVTPEQVQMMAQKYLKDDEMTMVIVGDISKIRRQVSAYGTVAMVP